MRITKPRGRITINVAMVLAALAVLAAGFLPQPALSSPDLATLRPNGPGAHAQRRTVWCHNSLLPAASFQVEVRSHRKYWRRFAADSSACRSYDDQRKAWIKSDSTSNDSRLLIGQKDAFVPDRARGLTRH